MAPKILLPKMPFFVRQQMQISTNANFVKNFAKIPNFAILRHPKIKPFNWC